MLWRLPPALRWYVIGVVAAAAAAAGTAAALTSWRSREVWLFATLVAFGAAVTEFTRRTTEPAGLVKDQHGTWLLPIALLLPPVYCLAAPAITFTLLQLRTRRTLAHRQVLSAATSGLSLAATSLAAGVLRTRLPWLWPGTGARPLLWLLAATGCALLGSVAGQVLVTIAIVKSDRTLSVRERLLSREPLLNDGIEICGALLLAGVIIGAGRVLLLPALPLVVQLQRSFRSAQLESPVHLDADTGLLTASAWRAEAAVQLAQARGTGSAVTVGIAELDHFGAVYDQHGHLAGSTVFGVAASFVAGGLRPDDLIGRFWGEGFVFLLPGTGAKEALQVAGRLRATLAAAQPIPAGRGYGPVHVTVSIGLATTADPAGHDVTDLLVAADTALNRAKQAGHDRICLVPVTPGSVPEPPGSGDAEEQPALGAEVVSEREEREEITAARRSLGEQLAIWRTRARMTQRELARRTGYSRSAVASAEAGQPGSAAFWAAADRAVGAAGRLAARQAGIEAAMTAARRRAARQAWRARAEAAMPGLASTMPDEGAMAVTDGSCPRCGESFTVTARVTAAVIPQITNSHPN